MLCPRPASPLAPAFSSQSLRMSFGEVSPWMELFPGVAMEIQQAHPLLHGLRDSRLLETDGDGLILGSFSCKGVKGKLSSGGWQQRPRAGLSPQSGSAGFGHCCAGASSGESSRSCFPCAEMCLYGLGILRCPRAAQAGPQSPCEAQDWG